MQARTGRVSVPSMNPAAHTETPIRERADHRGDHAGARSPQRHRRGRLTSVLLALGSVALLAGCASASAAPTPTPTPTQFIAGLFSTEDEAFAAAKDRFQRYHSLSDAATDETSFSLVRPYVTDRQWDYEYPSTMAFFEEGLSVIGSAVLTDFRLKSVSENSISITFCSDISGAHTYNAEGADVTPPNRSLRNSMEASLLVVGGELLVDDWGTSEVKSCGE